MNLGIDWLKVIQLKSKHLFGLTLLGGLILFLPERYAQNFGITDFRDSYRPWIGFPTLGFAVFFLIQFISERRTYYSSKKRISKAQEEVINSLNYIPFESWIIVAYCLRHRRQTITLKLNHLGIMEKAQETHSVLAWPYKIPSFLWSYLLKYEDEFFNRYPLLEEELRYQFHSHGLEN